MPVAVEGAVIRLDGPSRVEDAEALLACLRAAAAPMVDIHGAERLHAAVLQVLLAWRPPLIGAFADPFDDTWLMPMLRHPADIVTAAPEEASDA